MQDNDKIIIDADIDNNKDLKKLSLKEEQINIKDDYDNNENECNEENKIEQNQIKNEEYINIESINETESIKKNSNNKININNGLSEQIPDTDRGEKTMDKKVVIQKESTNNISNNNIFDISSTNPTKEESIYQNLDVNFQNQNKYQNNNEQKSNSQKNNENEKNIIDENEEFKSIENILNNKDNNKNQRNINNIIFNNKNKLYFTEADIPGNKSNKNNQRSNSSISYIMSPIQEYSKNVLVKTPNKLHMIEKGDKTQKRTKNSINSKLNNLSPNEYMKKKYINKYNFHPLQYRIKKIEEEIEKQNKYDFERAMKELQLKYDKEKKSKEKKKHIFELHKKLDEKLKNMEEKRTNLFNEKIQKIIKKLNKSNNKKDGKNINKSYDYNYNQQNNINGINKITNTIDSYGYTNNGKLPLISNLQKHELVKIIKEKNEEEFCNYTIKRLKDTEMIHRKNYLNQLNMLNNKLIKNNKLYKERSAKCLLATKNRDAELEEDYIEKDMLKRYNIKQILLRENSAKKERIKENLNKNLEGVKEKKELIEKKEKEKIKQIIKKLNREWNKENINNYYQRDYFANLQKENLKRYNDDINDYYKEIILRQGDNFLIANEIQMEGPTIQQAILKRSLKEQNKKNQKLKILDTHLNKMDRENINNKDEGTKRKLFQEKRKIEIEKKEKEEEMRNQ